MKYLWGISTILESFGAEFAAFNMGRHAQKIQYDLKSFDIEFENDLESRLLVAHSRELGSNYAYVGNASIYYSEGYGAHRFFVPAGDLNDFTEAMRAYQEELEQMTKAEATGYNMEEVNLNKLLEWIANKEDLGYDYNPDLDDSFYSVSGWLSEVTEPMNQIGMLAKAYGLKFEVRDNTLRAW